MIHKDNPLELRRNHLPQEFRFTRIIVKLKTITPISRRLLPNDSLRRTRHLPMIDVT